MRFPETPSLRHDRFSRAEGCIYASEDQDVTGDVGCAIDCITTFKSDSVFGNRQIGSDSYMR